MSWKRGGEPQSGVRRKFARAALAITLSIGLALPVGVSAQTTNGQYRDQNNVPLGSPVLNTYDDQSRDSTATRERDSTDQLRPIESVDINQNRGNEADDRTARDAQEAQVRRLDPRLKPIVPSDFEKYVETRVGRTLPRFGADLLLPEIRDYALPATATIPPAYTLNVGDVITIALTGSIDGSVNVEVDTNGKIFLPKVGSVAVAGVRYADLKNVISRAIGTQYRGYTVTVSVKKLRGIRVYVTGFANNPGAYTVNSLSTLVNAMLAAGGPSSGGSLRSAKLYRGGRLVADFDLYDLLLRGDRSGDAVLENEDVLFIPPLGDQFAIMGGVNKEAVFELKGGEAVSMVLPYAGGANVLADPSRVMLYRAGEPDKVSGLEIALADQGSFTVKGGDIIQVLTTGSLQRPIDRQTVVVRIEGEVRKPGNYIVPPNTSLSSIVEMAGGYTREAFIYGTKVERVSIKAQQREAFRDAIKQLEISLASTPLTSTRVDTTNRDAELNSARAVLDRLRKAEPDGRLVLDVDPDATALPGALIMETNDRITVPPRPVTVGVFGAVYRPATFVINPSKRVRVRDYVERAGGTLRAADRGAVFVVRASGDVISKRRGALNAVVLPGDVVFVPVKTESTSLLAKIRDISQVIFQLGIGAAAFVAVAR